MEKWDYIQKLISEELPEARVEQEFLLCSDIKNQAWLREVFEMAGDFGLKIKPKGPFAYAFLALEGKRLFLDSELSFNRYRSKFLSLSFFSDFDHINLQNQKSLCKSQERECLKVGMNRGVWTNSEAELYFGSPGEPGDLGSASGGSPGWKYNALVNTVYDIHFHEAKNIKRISIYDRLMVSGKLFPLKDILRPGFEKQLAGFLTRISNS